MAKTPDGPYGPKEFMLDGPRCQECGSPILNYAYCTKCGKSNPLFTLEGFEEDYGSLMAAISECDAGHPKVLEDVQKNRDLYIEAPHCGVCGVNLLRLSQF